VTNLAAHADRIARKLFGFGLCVDVVQSRRSAGMQRLDDDCSETSSLGLGLGPNDQMSTDEVVLMVVVTDVNTSWDSSEESELTNSNSISQLLEIQSCA